ncbi:MAG: septum formation inhibitor Maf [Magnetococcales bacterium]|nr:septum formation inhibitor Maf [Magnetococcales bacterium]
MRPPTLVLASTSIYRRQMLERLQVDFLTDAPPVAEHAVPGETPLALVTRLAREKAGSLAEKYPNALIIGGDQVAALGERILGKPESPEQAREQLRQASGHALVFLSGLCLYNSAKSAWQVEVVPFTVHFRSLDEATIDRYLQRDQPFDCAGSFRSEGLGVALCERMEGEDPTSLLGLPLIALCRMMRHEGYPIP